MTALEKEIVRLEKSGYGRSRITRRNGRALTIEEAAQWNLDADAIGNIADMARARRAPGSKTDREFFSGVGTLAQQCDSLGIDVNRLVAKAKARGYAPSASDFYQAPLDDAAGGSPGAFMSMAGGGRGQLKRECERQGRPCRGMVNVEARNDAPPIKAIPLADGIVNRMMKKAIAKDPDLAKKPRRELREMIVEKHGPRK